MPMQRWPPEVQAREQHLYHDLDYDTYIFRNRSDGIYFAVGGLDALGIHTIMMVADIVKYTSQRMKHIDYNQTLGYMQKNR